MANARGLRELGLHKSSAELAQLKWESEAKASKWKDMKELVVKALDVPPGQRTEPQDTLVCGFMLDQPAFQGLTPEQVGRLASA